ncbi:chitinase C-terminal domain-containing protein [Vibrio alginolyticus]|uniref:chitinase C-terminal domain-containing protein n=1 Tax=Vibrio TaxID=662 RepID=UPI0015591826|nr:MULTISPECIES: glycosyl hydrolase family 18 protein [Vibrio]EIE5863733.1 chitinase C-terminal domain-containing protein [Vibrio alginolyticus]EKA5861977.1 chitinase C-terminal domain-containing protein [Vibrio alginolyticus]ELA6637626.1 chitinase C-terminal domain-containing protein [Vibrio alginolyticus]ELK9266570.1 chitinase C-terminal domain-containing protein [Vibrio alginolyticus]ELN6906318.1 chitinase C-terminal domain-containing protein [Vibrio alginolyticus]
MHLNNGNAVKNVFTLSTLTASCLMAFNSYAAVDCAPLETWQSSKVYNGGDQVQHEGNAYKARYWTQNNNPAQSGEWGEWETLGACDGTGPVDPPQNEVPTVTLTSPSASASVTAGDVVNLAADAADTDGTVSKVEFFVDGVLVGQATSAPYAASWTATEGQHEFSTKAYDDAGAVSTASVVTLTVASAQPGNEAPTVDVVLSANSIDLGGSVTLTANATDADGTVAKVDFYVAGVLAGTATTAPYTLDVTPSQAGSLSVYAKATDDAGATADSALATLTVNGGAVTSNCRPDGLYQTTGVDVPYCSIYDEEGREKMGADHPRRVIGYFTSWRAGDDPQSTYLVKDIPWEQLTHINYAFVSIGSDGKVNVGDVNDPNNPATGKTWPGVEVDPALGFKGHFGALATYKQKHDVKTLISIGGWAETGGHFDTNGDRVADGGFYTMTTNADGSINHAGIEKFATSAVEMMRQYKFDGLDIDYEYPTSMAGAGNPYDKDFMEPRRQYLWASYQELMKVLREKLDAASAQDGIHYMLTIAAPSSGYLLRGMETFDVTKYLDYVNIMSYDLHGAWNDHVGHNAALFDTGKDSELAQWNVYGTAAYGGIGYLNTDWAYHYFRGSMPAGRINIGVPYYTRGWQGVTGGENGLWGRAALPNQAECQPGTGEGEKNNCGHGAIGIDNMWHDTDPKGNEMGAGSNPMWHAKNLENGIWGSYAAAYGLDPVNDPSDKFVGTYTRHYDSVAVAPWLWNAEKSVFLSTEDKASIEVKADYVIDKEIGGIMFWELAGDYNCYVLDANGNRTAVDATEQACAAGNGEYHMGNTMTKAIYDKFKSATPYGNKVATGPTPTEAVDITVSVGGFKVGDQNYPINPKITFTNNTGQAIPGGTEFQFDIPVSAPDNAKDQSGGGLKVIASGHTRANNIGGLDGVMHRVSFSLPAWKDLPAGGTYELDMVYYLPISGPANYSVISGGKEFAFKFEQPDLPIGDLNAGTGGGTTEPGTCDTTGLVTYPALPQTDWAGNPSHANQGDKIIHNGVVYQANWWTAAEPGTDGSWSTVCNI